MKLVSKLLSYFYHMSLVKQIMLSLLLGLLLAVVSPVSASYTSLLGTLFVGALKAVAPLLVFILVTAAIASHQQGTKTAIKPVLILYLIGTFSAALVAVSMSFLFPVTLIFTSTSATITPPGGIVIVLKNLLINAIDNPINALTQANFIGVLVWAVGLGIALRFSSLQTKTVFSDLAEGITKLVRVIIRLAPIGIFGLVSSTIAESGLHALLSYAKLLCILIGSMLLVAFILNPLIVYWKTRSNPYPLVLTCLRDSGITAFFTRSSAANIPINLALCEKLNIDKETAAISIPLGATINMAGAAITITVLTLAAVHTLNIQVDLATTLLLSVVSSICACGASGVAGGSLLLIPLACSLFGIDNNLAMQVVAVGFIIGILQDSFETALNSSTDVLFTVAACQAEQRCQTSIIES